MLEMPLHPHLRTGARASSPIMRKLSTPWFSHPLPAAEITIVRTRHELWSSRPRSMIQPEKTTRHIGLLHILCSPSRFSSFLRVLLLIFLLFCTLFHAFSEASPLTLGTLSTCRVLDFPCICYTRRPSHPISISSPLQPSSPDFVHTTTRPGAGASSGSRTGHLFFILVGQLLHDLSSLLGLRAK